MQVLYLLLFPPCVIFNLYWPDKRPGLPAGGNLTEHLCMLMTYLCDLRRLTWLKCRHLTSRKVSQLIQTFSDVRNLWSTLMLIRSFMLCLCCPRLLLFIYPGLYVSLYVNTCSTFSLDIQSYGTILLLCRLNISFDTYIKIVCVSLMIISNKRDLVCK